MSERLNGVVSVLQEMIEQSKIFLDDCGQEIGQRLRKRVLREIRDLEREVDEIETIDRQIEEIDRQYVG